MLIAGCGYVGAVLAGQLAADGHRVLGLRRQPKGLSAAVVPVAADVGDGAGLAVAIDAAAEGPVDALIYAAAPDGSADDAYRAVYVDGLRRVLDVVVRRGEPLRCVLFASSTSVYGQRAGEWVDEESATEPRDFRGARMLEAERLLLESGLPTTAVRLGGIYGPGRTRLVESVRDGRAQARRGHYTNRIHRDDAAGALRHLLALALGGEPLAPIYLGVDDDPADEATVVQWLAERLAVEPPSAPRQAARLDHPASARGAGARSEAKPSEVDQDVLQLSNPIGRRPIRAASAASEVNRRCRNGRLRATGYRFRFPTFREGYAALLTSPGS